jgi:hypothetical protein
LKKSPNAGPKNSNARRQGKGASTKINQTKSIQKSSSKNNINKQTDGKDTNPPSADGKRKANGNQRRQQQRGKNQNQNKKQADVNNNDTGKGTRKRKANNGNTSSTSNNNESTKRKKLSSARYRSGQK